MPQAENDNDPQVSAWRRAIGAENLQASSRPWPANRPGLAQSRTITEREREVLTSWAGKSNGEIAAQLCISTATAKAHVAHLLTKLGARDRVQLVIVAYEAGRVSPYR